MAALFSRPSIPAHRLGIVLRHTAAHFVHDAKADLATGIALFRRLSEPARGRGMVLGDAEAISV